MVAAGWTVVDPHDEAVTGVGLITDIKVKNGSIKYTIRWNDTHGELTYTQTEVEDEEFVFYSPEEARRVIHIDGRPLTYSASGPGLGGETIVTDPKTGGRKGTKPETYSMIPVYPHAEEARVYGFGATKYERDNWRKGYAWSLSLDALVRHLEAFRSGESHDPESGLHHLAHVKFHCNALMEFERLGLGTDDRGDL